MDRHLQWLLSLAQRVQSHFVDTKTKTIIEEYLFKLLNESKHSKYYLLKDSLLNHTATMVLFSESPVDDFKHLIESLKTLNDEDKQKLKPLTIITKLANREFILDIAGSQVIYGVKVKSPTSYAISAANCRYLYSAQEFSSNSITNYDTRSKSQDTFIKELNSVVAIPSESIFGGKKRNRNRDYGSSKPKFASSFDIKVAVLNRLNTYLRNNETLSAAIIYVNDMSDIDNHALDLMYTELRMKDAVIDYLKLLISEQYKDYKFEYNAHPTFSVPLDFRLKKFSCMMRNTKTNKLIYLVNLYNSASYEPIPVHKDISKDKYSLIAHPIVKIRFVLIDLHLLQGVANTASNKSESFNKTLVSMLHKNTKDLFNDDKKTYWVGFYKDESYARNQENMKTPMFIAYEPYII